MTKVRSMIDSKLAVIMFAGPIGKASLYVDSMENISLTLVYLELNRVYSRSTSPLDDGCSGTRTLDEE